MVIVLAEFFFFFFFSVFTTFTIAHHAIRTFYYFHFCFVGIFRCWNRMLMIEYIIHRYEMVDSFQFRYAHWYFLLVKAFCPFVILFFFFLCKKSKIKKVTRIIVRSAGFFFFAATELSAFGFSWQIFEFNWFFMVWRMKHSIRIYWDLKKINEFFFSLAEW